MVLLYVIHICILYITEIHLNTAQKQYTNVSKLMWVNILISNW